MTHTTHTCIHIHARTHMHTRTHAHTHTHTHTRIIPVGSSKVALVVQLYYITVSESTEAMVSTALHMLLVTKVVVSGFVYSCVNI